MNQARSLRRAPAGPKIRLAPAMVARVFVAPVFAAPAIRKPIITTPLVTAPLVTARLVMAPLVMALCLMLAACAPSHRTASAESPLVVRGGSPEQAERLVVVVPGALSSVDLYDPVFDWADKDTAVVAYRFPGVDGLPLDRAVLIGRAGREIARYVRAVQPNAVYLIGLSTGGPIVLEAARRLQDTHPQVAIISGAQPAPAAEIAALGSSVDLIRSALRTGSLNKKTVALDYFRTLLFGRNHFRRPDLAARSKALADANADTLLIPEDGMVQAHGAGLLTWVLRRPQDFARSPVTFFHGAEDSLFPLAEVLRTAARLPDARVLVYPDAGHLLFFVAPRVFNDIFDEFDLPQPAAKR